MRRSVAQFIYPLPDNGCHEFSRHLIECILEDKDPLINVEWGLHITEIMAAAVESSRTGTRYEMTTTLDI